MKLYEEVDVQFHAPLISTLERVSGQLHTPAALPLVFTRQ